MKILSLFPTLLDYSLLGIFLLRLTLGGLFFRFGWQQKRNYHGWLGLIIGILLMIGLWTQLAALLAALVTIIVLIIKKRSGELQSYQLEYLILRLVIALALLVLGPGAFSLDLPL